MSMAYFCCYNDYNKRLSRLSDEEIGRLFRALMAYSETGQRQDLPGLEGIAYDFITADIDRSKKNYRELCARNSEKGKQGGRPKKPQLSEKAGAFLKSQKEEEKEEEKEKEEEEKKEEEGKDLSVSGGSAGRAQPPLLSQDSPEYQAAAYLDEQIRARLPGQKPASEKRLQAWAREFDRCCRLDGREWEDVWRVLRFSQQDTFWSQNILSAGKFREKYLQLLAKLQAEGPPKQQASGYDREEIEEMARLDIPENL